MLLLDSRCREIGGFSVFPDHANLEQWYYMPAYPVLSTVRDAALGVDVPQFLLLGFRGSAGTGGFLNFDCNVGATQRQVDDVAREIANKENLANLPALGPVPLVDGSVRLMMLGRQSGDETQPDTAAPEFVLKIDHAAKPALYGSNQAAFSVRLDQDGYTVMEQCLEGEILPVAVVYSLDFLGLRPAYSIRLKIDWDRVQKHMDETFSAGVMFFSSEIGKAVDELVDSRAIVLESDTFVPEGDDTQGIIDRRDAALAQVRSMITDAFFTVSLPPWTPEKKPDWERALEAASKLATQHAAMAAGGPAAAGTSSVSFSYKRMDYQRMDRKSLNVNLSERVTVRKSIYPQGHLAALFKPLRDGALDRDRFVRQVSLDNDWFAKRRLKVSARADFAADGLASINVRARYGDKPQNQLLVPGRTEAEFEWLSVIDDGAMRRDVEVSYEVGFGGVDGAERPLSLAAEPETCDVEHLEIVPRELYAVTPIPLIAENFPWDRYSSVEVHLRYADEAHRIRQVDMVRLTKDKPEGLWKLFSLDPAKTGYEQRLVFRAVDHRDVDRGWQPSDEAQVTVRNPFPTRRVLEIVPSLKWDEVSEAFVDLRYEDEANDVFVEESFTFRQGDATQRFGVDLRDAERKTIYYRVSIAFKDGRFLELPESMTNERRVSVRADMKARRLVSVRPPAAFADRRLRKVGVEMRFEDFAAGLSFANRYEFESGMARGEFEYDIVDDARRQYEYRTVVQFANGMEQATDWQASDAPELVVRLP